MTTEFNIQDNESVLWSVYNETKKGVFRRKVVSTNRIAITNRRIVVNDYELGLNDISEVVVLNKHSVSQYTNYNVRSGGYNRTGAGFGNIKGSSKTVGDLVIISPNRDDIILREVSDCNGVKDLINALRREVGG